MKPLFMKPLFAGAWVLKPCLSFGLVSLLSACAVSPVITEPSDKTVLYAINAGGGAYQAQDGTAYMADDYVKGGSFGSTSDVIAGTAEQTLFKHERWGRFIYALPVKEGEYDVTLHFAETWFGPEHLGNRTFNVAIEGVQQLEAFDPLLASGHDSAYTVTFKSIAVIDGELTIDFAPVHDSASVRGVVVKGLDGHRLAPVPSHHRQQVLAAVPSDCPSAKVSSNTDFVLFDGGKPPGPVIGNTLELRNDWFLDETWATASGAVVELEKVAEGVAITYRNAKGFSGFKLTPPAAQGKRKGFKLSGLDLYIEANQAGPEFGIRVIKPGEPENHGHASTATWLENAQGQSEISLSKGCTLLSLKTPESWSVVDDEANRFILEVREGWNKSHNLNIRRIVVKGFSDAD